MTVPPGTDLVTTQEVVTAIARIGGKRAGDFFNGALSGRVAVITDNPAVVHVPEDQKAEAKKAAEAALAKLGGK